MYLIILQENVSDKKLLVNIIPWAQDIGIKSVRVQLEEILALNLISLSLAKFLGFRIQKEKNQMALVGNEPLALCGKTHVLIRLPPSPKSTTNKFERILMTVAVDPKTHIILSSYSQVLLGLLPKKYIMHKDRIKNKK